MNKKSCIYIYTYTYKYTYYLRLYIYTYIHTYIYIYIYTHRDNKGDTFTHRAGLDITLSDNGGTHAKLWTPRILANLMRCPVCGTFNSESDIRKRRPGLLLGVRLCTGFRVSGCRGACSVH